LTQRVKGSHVMNCSQLLEEAEDRFGGEGLPTPGLDAQVLLAHSIGRDRGFLYAHPERVLSSAEATHFRSLVARRIKGEPVAYITGEKEFWSLTFEVSPDVLIPRPDTEILVEEVLKLFGRDEKIRILEIGTGSGAISIALASEREQVSITATDCSPEILMIAARNALNNNVRKRISFLCGDMFEPVRGIYDIIISNPPYISEEEFSLLAPGVRGYEPRRALLAGPDGTQFHRGLVQGARPFLAEGGWLAMELGVGQRDVLEKILHESDYCDIAFHCDYAGIERVVLAKMRS